MPRGRQRCERVFEKVRGRRVHVVLRDGGGQRTELVSPPVARRTRAKEQSLQKPEERRFWYCKIKKEKLL